MFTEYADTAVYLADALAERGISRVNAVTGSDANPTLAARRFSPKSNASLGGMPKGEEPIRVLVSTDVLSEGQNLQDARVIVNYDLPWAVVRMVQRAGRVDRIGQTADEVVVASMLPPGGVEEVIGNHRRIRERLDANAVVFGGGERFFGTLTKKPPSATPSTTKTRPTTPTTKWTSCRWPTRYGAPLNETTPAKPPQRRPSPTSSTPPSPGPATPTSRASSFTSRPTTRSTHSHSHLSQAARHTPSQPAKRCASPPANPTPRPLQRSENTTICWPQPSMDHSAPRQQPPKAPYQESAADAGTGCAATSTAPPTTPKATYCGAQQPSTPPWTLCPGDPCCATPAKGSPQPYKNTATTTSQPSSRTSNTRNELCVPEAAEIAPPHIICSMGLIR